MTWPLLLGLACAPAVADPHREVRGITVSTPTWGVEWGSDAMAATLDQLAADGANWVAIHPYARVDRSGAVSWRVDPTAEAPPWLARPIAEAHARGLKVLVVPHLAYWGEFSWRGDIRFDDDASRERFFAEYTTFIVDCARLTRDTDAFAVGSELDQTIQHEASWREVVRRVREVTPANLTYAANWDRFEDVRFWDAVDTVGIQAYFPLVREGAWPAGTLPPDDVLREAWAGVFARTDALSRRTGKPVVFTELGYDRSDRALIAPWDGGTGGDALQEAALRVALEEIGRSGVRGAFLWKWFPGEIERGDFRLTRPEVRQVIRDAWKAP